jgi:hypothetical protein
MGAFADSLSEPLANSGAWVGTIDSTFQINRQAKGRSVFTGPTGCTRQA